MPNMIKVNYSLTAYKNTGFNGFDIPATPAVLEEAEKTVYNDTYYLREDFDNPIIQVNDNYHNMSDVDYIKLHANTMVSNQPTDIYYFCVPKAMAGGTTALALSIDGLLTLGGAENLEYTSGWQYRGHITKEEDTLFGNVASEDFAPKHPLETTDYSKIDITNDNQPANDLNVIISTMDIADAGYGHPEAIECYGAVLEFPPAGTPIDPADYKMYVPKGTINQHPTKFVSNPGILNTYSNPLYIPSVRAFNGDNAAVRYGIEKLYSYGLLDLSGSYTIPKEYVVNPTEDTYGGYNELKGIQFEKSISSMPFEYVINGYNVKNKKCFSYFRTITLMNVASGAALSKPVYELKNEAHGNAAPYIRVWSDPLSTGKPYARFLSDTAPEGMPYLDTVEGAQWCCRQVVMEGASGSAWNAQQFANNQKILSDAERQAVSHVYTQAAMGENSLKSGDIGAQNSWVNAGKNIAGDLLSAVSSSINNSASNGGHTQNITVNPRKAGAAGINIGFKLNDLESSQQIYGLTKENQTLAYGEAEWTGILQANRVIQMTNENAIGAVQNRISVPTVLFTPTPNAAMYGLNKFYIFETKMNDEDVKSLDLYFQMYGYNGLNKKLTADCFKARQYYNFVQAFNINLKSNKSTSMRLKMKAISQLNGGVRLWKVLPDASYYDIN